MFSLFWLEKQNTHSASPATPSDSSHPPLSLLLREESLTPSLVQFLGHPAPTPALAGTSPFL